MEEPRKGAEERQSVLVVAPLALDAVTGCGGTLARLSAQGARVQYLVAYDFGALEARARRACRILGVMAEDIYCLKLEMRTPEERVRACVRRGTTDLAGRTSPALVFLPSLHSIDPRDAWVAREAFEALRGRTLLSYERAPGLHDVHRPVVVVLSQAQASAKLRAMRPRRLRSGSRPAQTHGPAFEVLEIVQWEAGAPLVLDEMRPLMETFA